MAIWIVRGEMEGKPVAATVEAESAQAAKGRASAKGIAVRSVAVKGPRPPTALSMPAATMASIVAVDTPPMRSCGNCGRFIGRLETPGEFKGQIVCGACLARLSPPALPLDYAAEDPAAQAPFAPPSDIDKLRLGRGRVRVQTIEQTGKKWKLFQLVGTGIAMLGGGCAVVSFGAAPAQRQIAVWSAVVFFAMGFLLFVHGRLGAWWHHG